jgi:hypothetical protein
MNKIIFLALSLAACARAGLAQDANHAAAAIPEPRNHVQSWFALSGSLTESPISPVTTWKS